MKASLLTALLGVALLACGQAGAADSPKVMLVKNGMTKFTVAKHQIIAVRARRENFNVHSFDVVTFYEAGDKLNIVPLFSEDKKEQKEEFNTTAGGGADCQLHDFRFVKAEGKQPARLILADRDFGESYADDATVRFTWYELVAVVPDEDSEGRPAVYFEAKKKTSSRKKFCDVNEAFDKELHLGDSSGAGPTRE